MRASETSVQGQSDRRGQLVSLSGLLVSAILFGSVLAVGMWPSFGSDAVTNVAIHLAGGIPIWVIVLVVFRQSHLSKLEDLETEQLRRAQEAGLATNMFDVGDESMLLHRRRLNWTYKFLVPGVTLIVAAYHLSVAGAILTWKSAEGTSMLLSPTWRRSPEPFAMMLLLGGVAVFCFAFSRYVIGMARERSWRLLRAGGSYVLGNALTATVVVVAMILAQWETTQVWAEPAAVYVIRVGMGLLGIEILVNFILDFYRPRRAEVAVHPAFESRLLALFSQPGGVMRSIAQTINYQFGFEVSSTWFYKLIQRAVFPLVTLTAVALILLSSVTIVDVDERAHVERFGRLVHEPEATLAAGLHIKWPWPIDRVVRERVAVLRTMIVGSEEASDQAHDEEDDDHDHELEHNHDVALLWGEEHDVSETPMLVASPSGSRFGLETSELPGAGRRSKSVAVSLMMVSVEIDYRIKSLFDYAYRFADPESVLRTIAYQELSDYVSGTSIVELMGVERKSFGEGMRDRLQRRCDDELNLGIEILFVSLQEAHPPSESSVATTFQNVVAAEIKKTAAIESARGEANRILTLTAGSLERARALDQAIRELDALTSKPEKAHGAELEAAGLRVEQLLFGDSEINLAQASGAVAGEISAARTERSASISAAESKTRAFVNELVAYRAAPRLYPLRRYLELLKSRLPAMRKFVFTGTGGAGDLIIEYETEKRSTLDLDTSANAP